MGNPTGFIEFARELPTARAPAERIHDWSAINQYMKAEK